MSGTIALSDAIAVERKRYVMAARQSDTETAWRALERAHILSQPMLGQHMHVHWLMLCYAVRLRDIREMLGQIARLALAPIGALAGRVPMGNTGRSNVSAFAPMPIPEDLRPLLAKKHDNSSFRR